MPSELLLAVWVLLPWAFEVATSRGCFCYHRRPVLLPAEAGFATVGGRGCYRELLPWARCCVGWPALLPWANGVAASWGGGATGCGRVTWNGAATGCGRVTGGGRPRWSRVLQEVVGVETGVHERLGFLFFFSVVRKLDSVKAGIFYMHVEPGWTRVDCGRWRIFCSISSGGRVACPDCVVHVF